MSKQRDPYANGGRCSPFNEDGEPIMDAGDWRREQEADARTAEEDAAGLNDDYHGFEPEAPEDDDE